MLYKSTAVIGSRHGAYDLAVIFFVSLYHLIRLQLYLLDHFSIGVSYFFHFILGFILLPLFIATFFRFSLIFIDDCLFSRSLFILYILTRSAIFKAALSASTAAVSKISGPPVLLPSPYSADRYIVQEGSRNGIWRFTALPN